MTKKSRTRDARQRRKKEQSRTQQRTILAGIVVVAVLVIALIIVSNQPVEAYVPPELETRYDGLSYSLSIEGFPRIGDSDAPVTINEYSSFSCPGCEAFHSTSFDAILDRVRTGQVLFTYVPLQTGSLLNASGAARAALCAGQQGMFWEMHDVLFEWHTLYSNTAYSGNRLLAGASALGMNVDSFNGCFNSGAISNILDAALAEGVLSTPTIEVNGVTVTSSEDGGIPTTEEVLAAIDDATPNDWTPNAVDSDESESDTPEATEEATQEPVADEATEEPDVVVDEATEEPDAVVEEATEEPDSESAADTPEATEEADD